MTEHAMERLAQAQVHDEDPVGAASIASAGSSADPVVRMIGVSADPLQLSVHGAAIDHPRAGGRVIFSGVVRDRAPRDAMGSPRARGRRRLVRT